MPPNIRRQYILIMSLTIIYNGPGQSNSKGKIKLVTEGTHSKFKLQQIFLWYNYNDWIFIELLLKNNVTQQSGTLNYLKVTFYRKNILIYINLLYFSQISEWCHYTLMIYTDLFFKQYLENCINP